MVFENELSFLCDTFRKCHVRASVVMPGEYVGSIVDSELCQLFGYSAGNKTVGDFLGQPEPGTMYRATAAMSLCFIYLQLPSSGAERLLFVGPFFSAPFSQNDVLELGEKNRISPKNQKYLAEYLSAIPVLPADSHLFAMLSTFCERIWNSLSFPIVEIAREAVAASPAEDRPRPESPGDMMMYMSAMEQRYNFENELIQAVSLGQLHKENQLLSAVSESIFERRVADPLRNVKNYCIIMNTLLRKAAESGGVHPMYLDSTSSAFAIKIEQLAVLHETQNLMREMFRAYCRLVRERTMKNLSPVVQKAMLLIDADLSADLSLKALAEDQNISAGYLSTVFKRETGKTLSQHIREKRMQRAVQLLRTTHLQVQTIALHCGIMDVQYFCRIFKKHTGKTPKEYRESIKKSRKSTA